MDAAVAVLLGAAIWLTGTAVAPMVTAYQTSERRVRASCARPTRGFRA
jgi:hypothetical protein